MNFYNENNPYAAKWLGNLSGGGRIATGHVDSRSIRDVQPGELADYTQCHFFAGIGVWSYALRLAGWPDDRPVWTGSCPCQPFSAAGRKRGVADERHLWPEWFRLIRECRPHAIFGEQVASPDGLAWFDAVSADLEGEGYAVGAVDSCAAGVGAPHIRQRLFFVAVPDVQRRDGERLRVQPGRSYEAGAQAHGSGEAVWLADAAGSRPVRPEDGREDRGDARGREGRLFQSERGREAGDVADAERVGGGARRASGEMRRETIEPDRHGATRGFWSDAEWIPCRDGKARPIEPGTSPLAHGVTGRVGKLRAFGNAIVAPLAAKFIEAAMMAMDSP